MRLVVVFTLVSTFLNRKMQSGVGKIAEEELVSVIEKPVGKIYRLLSCRQGQIGGYSDSQDSGLVDKNTKRH